MWDVLRHIWCWIRCWRLVYVMTMFVIELYTEYLWIEKQLIVEIFLISTTGSLSNHLSTKYYRILLFCQIFIARYIDILISRSVLWLKKYIQKQNPSLPSQWLHWQSHQFVNLMLLRVKNSYNFPAGNYATVEISLEFWASVSDVFVPQICCSIWMKFTEHLEQVDRNVLTKFAELGSE